MDTHGKNEPPHPQDGPHPNDGGAPQNQPPAAGQGQDGEPMQPGTEGGPHEGMTPQDGPEQGVAAQEPGRHRATPDGAPVRDERHVQDAPGRHEERHADHSEVGHRGDKERRDADHRGEHDRRHADRHGDKGRDKQGVAAGGTAAAGATATATTSEGGEPRKGGMKFTLKRTLASFTKHGCTDLAAALTYYSVMSVFPMAIALISTLGLFGNGEKTTDALLDIPRDLGAGDDTVAQMESYINSMQGTGGAGIAFVIGLVGALWAASNYVNAFSRALNTIYGVREGRPIYILRPVLLLVTFTILVLIVVVALSLVLTGPVASAVGNVVGLGSTAVLVWNIAKWPFIALMVVGIIALLYFATPNVKKPKFRWFSSGAIFALVVWILASAAFGVYVSQFGNYNATYGALAGVIVGLLWVWLTNVALLFGAELDAEKERTRELESGVPAERRIQLPVRGDKGIKKALKKEEELLRESHELRLANSHQEPSKGTHQAIALEKAEQADDPAEAREHSATAMAPRDGVDRVVEDPRPTRADEN